MSSREELFHAHRGFAFSCANGFSFRNPLLDKSDLEQTALIALWQAAGRYDADRGIKFTTYARPRIIGAIRDEMRRWMHASRQEVSRAKEAGTFDELMESRAMLSIDSVLQKDGALLHELVDGGEDTFHDVDVADRADVVYAAIATLPNRLRMIVYLHYFEAMSQHAIGDVIGVSESRVNQLLVRAKQTLAPQLEQLAA